MIEGTLIAESLRPGTELGGMRLAVLNLSRVAAGDVAAGQPELWTLIEVEAGEAAGRAEAAAYGRSVGIPEGQLDWPV